MSVKEKILFFGLLLASNFSFLFAFINATPTVYVIYLKKLELRQMPASSISVSAGSAIIPTVFNLSNNTGEYITIFEGSKALDIASVIPGALVDILDDEVFVPPGNYDAVRMTISQEFQISASALISGINYRTDSSNGTCNPFAFPAKKVGVTTQDANPATTQVVYMPEGDQILAWLERSGYLRNDTDDTLTSLFLIYPFTISKTVTLTPTISMVCDVSDSVVFEATIDPTYPVVVTPNNPSISFEVILPETAATQ
ncbi:MAG: hypothetical protein WC371_03365 [Parachlamydiales bacterium]|jgi:hypothetical protein